MIELLVVIAIIMILARLLLPALENARSKAISAACASNLHHLGIGFKLYAQDYDNYIPGFGYSGGCSKAQSDWVRPGASAYPCSPGVSAMGRYINQSDKPCNQTALNCPIYAGNNTYGSYVMTSGLALNEYSCPYNQIKFGNVVFPSGTYLLVEAHDDQANEATLNGNWSTSDRHTGGNNALFCDGHASWSLKGNTSTRGTRDFDLQCGHGVSFRDNQPNWCIGAWVWGQGAATADP